VTPFLREKGVTKLLAGYGGWLDGRTGWLSEQRSSDNRRAKLVRSVFEVEAGMLQTLKSHRKVAEKYGDHLRYFQTDVWPRVSS
jgi:hypothetical protein